MKIKKCNCRFQLGDNGYYECDLEKNHIGNHKYSENKLSKNNWRKRAYAIEWERDEKKDIIITLKWIKKNTNLEDICNKILKKYNFLSCFTISGTSEKPIYGSAFHCDITFDFKQEIKEQYYFKDYENYLKFIKDYCEIEEYFKFEFQLLKEIKKDLNIKEEEYDLNIFVNVIDY